MSIIGSNILAGAAGSGASAYEIEQSLRFDSGQTGTLTRTPSSNGGSIHTTSAWIKASDPTLMANIFAAYPSESAYGTSGTYDILGWYQEGPYSYVGNGGANESSLYLGAIDYSYKFRDTSAWYHVIWVSTSTQFKIYVNGVLVASKSRTQNNSHYNQNKPHRISAYRAPNGSILGYINCYMAEVHFIDGQALDDEDFGEFDESGVWRPIEYTGTYGTNGYYLKFDPTATNGIGHDHSGNGNNWTASNFTTSGTGTDVMSDTPTKNWATLNPLHNGAQVGPVDGNLKFAWSSTGNYHQVGTATIGMPGDGKWYWEVTKLSTRSDSESIGILREDGGVNGGMRDGQSGTPSYSYELNGEKNKNASGSAYGATYAQNDVIGVAVDLTPGGTSGTITFYKNGTSQGVAFSDIDTSYTWLPAVDGYGQSPPSEYTLNFGQREFANPPGTIGATDYFNTVTYTGTSAEHAITGVGFQPDFMWIKGRTNTTNHVLVDVVRGSTNVLESDSSAAAYTDAQSVKSFDADGFTLGTSNDVNNSASGYNSYVAWCWKAGGTAVSNTDGSITSQVSANNNAGFSIVTWTGTGANGDYGHGLDDVPAMIFHKRRDSTSDWHVWHKGLPTDNPTNDVIYLNLPDGENGGNNNLFRQDPTDTLIYTGSAGSHNTLNGTYVDYVWTEKPGVSKFGSYDGNGSSTEGPVISCGFRPAMVMIKWAKDVSTSESWQIYDNKRAGNPNNTVLAPDADAVEESPSDRYIQFTADGFQLKSNGQQINRSGAKYIFAAWAATFTAGDYKALNTANLPAPTIKDGSDYFNTLLYTGDGTSSRAITGMGFQADFLWLKPRSARNHSLVDVLRGTNHLQSNNTNAEASVPSFDSFDSDGFTVTADGSTNPNWNESPEQNVVWGWLAGGSGSSNTTGSITSTVSANPTAGFSIVTFTKTGGTTTSNTVGHGLGVAPAMLILKGRVSGNVDNWYVYHQSLGPTYRTFLNTTAASFSPTETWNDTAPTSSVFTVKNFFDGDSVAYCFAEVEGYSKIGSYVGNGSTDGVFVHCGFKPRWLLVKSSSNPYGWAMFDTARQTYNEIEILLEANNSSAEASNSAWGIDILSNGFKWRNGGEVFNYSGYTYIFLAFAEHPTGGSGVSPATAR